MFRYSSVIRCAICFFGAGAIVWSVSSIPTLIRSDRLIRVAEALRKGEEFGPSEIRLAQQIGDASVTGSARIGLVLISLASFERALRLNDFSGANREYEILQRSLIRCLDQAPTDPFVWLVMFSLSRNAPSGPVDDYLVMSYSLGPYEGWIAERRNVIALQDFVLHRSDVAKLTVREFISLANSNLSTRAATIFTESSFFVQSLLRQHFEEIPEPQRRSFLKAIEEQGPDFNSTDGSWHKN
jgi:hypothetical protein